MDQLTEVDAVSNTIKRDYNAGRTRIYFVVRRGTKYTCLSALAYVQPKKPYYLLNTRYPEQQAVVQE
jgi:hypothetical protein